MSQNYLEKIQTIIDDAISRKDYDLVHSVLDYAQSALGKTRPETAGLPSHRTTTFDADPPSVTPQHGNPELP